MSVPHRNVRLRESIEQEKGGKPCRFETMAFSWAPSPSRGGGPPGGEILFRLPVFFRGARDGPLGRQGHSAPKPVQDLLEKILPLLQSLPHRTVVRPRPFHQYA